MKASRLVLGFALLVSTTAVMADDAPPLSAAVLDFREAEPALEGTGASASNLLQVKLSAVLHVVLVERAELHEILAEHELTLSDAVLPGQAAKVGQLTGAEVIITGRVFNVQDRTHLVAKVVSTSNGRVFGAATDLGKGGRLDAAVDSLAGKVADLLRDKVVDLRGSKPLEERVLEMIRERMEGQPSPKTHVFVREAVIQAVGPDPAAQTELRRTLGQAGWMIVESESEADMMIHGDAFAEVGVRRGNLWFTRARLEFTVKERGGKVLATDRVVAGNVDLAQLTSCKGALQKAGLLASLNVVDAWLASRQGK